MKAQMVAVNSTAIQSVAFNERKSKLHIVFNNGTRYVYSDVPFKTVMKLLAADSIGRFFNYNIRNQFNFVCRG